MLKLLSARLSGLLDSCVTKADRTRNGCIRLGDFYVHYYMNHLRDDTHISRDCYLNVYSTLQGKLFIDRRLETCICHVLHHAGVWM